jgi:hypothetical protein
MLGYSDDAAGDSAELACGMGSETVSGVSEN